MYVVDGEVRVGVGVWIGSNVHVARAPFACHIERRAAVLDEGWTGPGAAELDVELLCHQSA